MLQCLLCFSLYVLAGALHDYLSVYLFTHWRLFRFFQTLDKKSSKDERHIKQTVIDKSNQSCLASHKVGSGVERKWNPNDPDIEIFQFSKDSGRERCS